MGSITRVTIHGPGGRPKIGWCDLPCASFNLPKVLICLDVAYSKATTGATPEQYWQTSTMRMQTGYRGNPTAIVLNKQESKS